MCKWMHTIQTCIVRVNHIYVYVYDIYTRLPWWLR